MTELFPTLYHCFFIGTFQSAGVIEAAYELNVPVCVSRSLSLPSSLPDSQSYVQLDTKAVVLEALKKVRITIEHMLISGSYLFKMDTG